MTDNQNFKNISNLDPDTIKNLKSSGKADKILNSLTEDQKQKLNTVLNDKNALEEILKSPQAIALMKMFGGNNNG